jgi:hypothetical protein
LNRCATRRSAICAVRVSFCAAKSASSWAWMVAEDMPGSKMQVPRRWDHGEEWLAKTHGQLLVNRDRFYREPAERTPRMTRGSRPIE